jgi:hypothetical protein
LGLKEESDRTEKTPHESLIICTLHQVLGWWNWSEQGVGGKYTACISEKKNLYIIHYAAMSCILMSVICWGSWSRYIYVRFEVFMAVTMKNAVFWNVAPCRSCVNRRFGGMYRIHLQGRKIREQVAADWATSLKHPAI